MYQKPQFPISTIKQQKNKNSPDGSPYVSLKNLLKECDKQSKHFPLGDHFSNSLFHFSWLCIDIVERNLVLVTLG